MSESLGSVFIRVCPIIIQNAQIEMRFFQTELGSALVQFDGPRKVLLQPVLSEAIFRPKEPDCHRIACVDSLSDHGKDLTLIWRGCPAERTVPHAAFPSCQKAAIAHFLHAAFSN